MPKTSLRVIVVGGSMGGLTAALVLRKIGYDVDVFERSSALLESRGAGIISHRITLRYPTEFGGYQLGDLSIRPLWCRYFDGQGRVVSERPCGFRVNSYGALYRSLLHCFGQERYHLGRSVTGFREDAGKVLPPALTELVVRTKEPFVQAIFDGWIPAMAFGRVCIMGDAAFVARPHCAAGTAKAAEDAWQLGEALTETGNDVVAALKKWEERQLKCGRQPVARAREIGNRFQFENSWPAGEPFPYGLYQPGDSGFPP